MSQKAKSAPRLGRGLSSLISVAELPVEGEIASPALASAAQAAAQNAWIALCCTDAYMPRYFNMISHR